VQKIAVADRFFRSLKNEWTKHESFADLDAARWSIFKYIEAFYNSDRIHQALNYQTPNQFEESHAASYAV
jgi:putative transposase